MVTSPTHIRLAHILIISQGWSVVHLIGLRLREFSKLSPGEQRAHDQYTGGVTQHAELGSRITVYLASLSCLAMIMRMVTKATITMAAKGRVTARATAYTSEVGGLVVGTVTCGQKKISTQPLTI